MKSKQLFLCSLKAVAALLLTVTIAIGLSACSTDDVPAYHNVNPADVVGYWYAEYNHEGVAGEGEHAKAFSKVVLYGTLLDEGAGFWICLLIDAEGNAVDLEDTFLGAGCKYTVSQDGKVDIVLTGSSGAVTLHPSWTMDYRNGQLVGRVRDDVSCVMSPLTDERLEQVKVWLRQLGLGYSEEPVGLDAPVRIIDLSTLPGNYEATDGDVLTGKMPVNDYGIPKYLIVIPDGAHVTLDNVTIWGDKNANRKFSPINPAIHCNGDATITIKGTNNLSGYWSECPCIYVPEGNTLTILDADGKLYVENSGNGAGIGGGKQFPDCGNIIFNNCEVYAQGGDDAPAVGSYKGGRCGTIQFIHCCYIEGRGGKNAVAFGCGSKGYCKEISHIWGYDESYGEVIGYAGEGADAVFGHPGDGQCERINVTSITIAYCSKEPTDTMYISDFLKADYVSLMRQPELLDFDWSVWPMEDGFFMKPCDPWPVIRRRGYQLAL